MQDLPHTKLLAFFISMSEVIRASVHPGKHWQTLHFSHLDPPPPSRKHAPSAAAGCDVQFVGGRAPPVQTLSCVSDVKAAVSCYREATCVQHWMAQVHQCTAGTHAAPASLLASLAAWPTSILPASCTGDL